MSRHFLHDTVEFMDGVEIDAMGILRGRARIGRIGVQEYMIDGELVGVLRSEEEVRASNEGFAHQVVTLNHPPAGVMIDSSNAKQYQVGLNSTVDFVDGWQETLVTVTDADAVAAARTTHKQFSNGYWADLQPEEGEWVDELGVQGIVGSSYPYKYVQKDITGNHISLVIAARAGDSATFKDNVKNPNKCFTIIKDEASSKRKLMTYQITDKNGTPLVVEGDNAQAVVAYINQINDELAKANKERDTANQNVKDLQIQVDTITEEKDSLNETIQELKSNGMVPTDAETMVSTKTWLYSKYQDAMGEIVKDTVDLWTTYKDMGCDEKLIDYALTDTAIKKSILSQKVPNFDADFKDADDAQIETAWKLKDRLIPQEKTKQKDTINEALRRRIEQQDHNTDLTDDVTRLHDAQLEYARRASESSYTNM